MDARPRGRDCAAGGLAEARGFGSAVVGCEVKERAAGGRDVWLLGRKGVGGKRGKAVRVVEEEVETKGKKCMR